MAETVPVQRTSVFADGDGGGNPCPMIVEAHGLSDVQMQAVARYYGQESGFVVSAAADPVVRLRFFVPQHEMSMCVHATAAATALLVEAGRLSGGAATVETGIGSVAVDWQPGTGGLPTDIGVHQWVPVPSGGDPDAAEVAQVLGVGVGDLDLTLGAPASWSASRPKLVVPLRRMAVLDALEPRWEAMWELCAAHATTGIYAVVLEEGPRSGPAVVSARQFPVRAGYDEDAATGVAAAALAGYLHAAAPQAVLTAAEGLDDGVAVVRYVVHQGRAMRRPSTLKVEMGVQADGAVRDIRVVGDVIVTATERLEVGALAGSSR